MWQTIMCASSMRPMCGTPTWIFSCAIGPSLPPSRPVSAMVSAADGVRVLDRAQHVRRIARTADAEHHIAADWRNSSAARRTRNRKSRRWRKPSASAMLSHSAMMLNVRSRL